MAFSKQFEKVLDELFKQRTHRLLAKLGFAKPGKPPNFSRRKVDKCIAHLQELASKAFSQTDAKTQFNKHTKRKNWRHIKGYGWKEKKKNLKKWYQKLKLQKGVVYTFWNRNNRCLYVGKTGAGGTRPVGQFEKYKESKKITIFETKGRSRIPLIECLAVHRYQPLHNTNTPETKKWTKACPLCKKHKLIENEMRKIFRLR